MKELLRWISLAHPQARVSVEGQEIGAWQGVVAGWHDGNGKIHIRLNIGGVSRMHGVLAARSAPWGAAFSLRGPGSQSTYALRAVWGKDAHDEAGDSLALGGLLDWIRRTFDQGRVLSACRRVERAFSLSGTFLRLILRCAGTDHLLMAPADAVGEEHPHTMLTQALIWITRLQSISNHFASPLVHLLAPEGKAEVLRHRAEFLNPARIRLEVLSFIEPSQGNGWLSRPASLPFPRKIGITGGRHSDPIGGVFP